MCSKIPSTGFLTFPIKKFAFIPHCHTQCACLCMCICVCACMCVWSSVSESNPGGLPECSLGFQTKLRILNLHFNKIPRWSVYTLKFEMNCHRRCRRTPELHWRKVNGVFEWYIPTIATVSRIFNKNEQLL